MENALIDAKCSSNEIEYINAHGTSTKLNDLTESKAIKKLFNQNPLVSSTKSIHGHALGAAEAIETALCCMMIKKGKLILTINVSRDSVGEDIEVNLLLEEVSNYNGGKILNNSFAFGGHNASILLSKFQD